MPANEFIPPKNPPFYPARTRRPATPPASCTPAPGAARPRTSDRRSPRTSRLQRANRAAADAVDRSPHSRLKPEPAPKRRFALPIEPHKGPGKRSSPRRPGQSIPHGLQSPQRAFMTVYGTITPLAPWIDAVDSRRKRPFTMPHVERRGPTPGDRFPAAPRDDR